MAVSVGEKYSYICWRNDLRIGNRCTEVWELAEEVKAGNADDSEQEEASTDKRKGASNKMPCKMRFI